MANEIQELLKEIKEERLRSRLSAAVAELRKTKKFGLVFEEHLPELLPIYSAKVRVQTRVARRDGKLTETFVVQKITKGVATVALEAGAAPQEIPVAELVVVKRFGEAIFPALRHVESVLRGGDAPHHTLIEADNYHALQFLGWLYAGKVDCIYIDPPYNTGARDWKYNNDYVDGNDAWRHSKWLSMMQRRLLLARRLLNPADSTLIITIDEKEYLRLGMLLEQTFPEARIQMISSVISQKGSARSGEFSRCDEFIFFVMLGQAAPLPLDDDMLHETVTSTGDEVEWGRLKRNGKNGRRERSAALFYPIFLNADGSFHSTGAPLPKGQSRESVRAPRGTVAVFPVLSGGQEMSWGISREKLTHYVPKGFVKFGSIQAHKHQKSMIYYLTSGYVEAAERGEIVMVGTPDAPKWVHQQSKGMRPMTVWAKVSHDAGWHGSRLLDRFIPDRKFPFPKSLFAVEDALRFFVKEKPNAVVLDFFSGSGTTAHAVMRLNRQDGAHRQCISVTNNEVAADEQKALGGRGLQPSHLEWEKLGICQHVTFPRLTAAISGKTPDGKPIIGDYKFNDEFPMAEGFAANLDYFRLDFLDRSLVETGGKLADILPALWMMAGCRGKLPTCKGNEKMLFFKDCPFAVLVEEGSIRAFLAKLEERSDVGWAFLVTNDQDSFARMCEWLPERIPPEQRVHLWRNYVDNFLINVVHTNGDAA